MTNFIATIMAIMAIAGTIISMGYERTTIVTQPMRGTRQVYVNEVLVEEQAYNYELGEWEVIDE